MEYPPPPCISYALVQATVGLLEEPLLSLQTTQGLVLWAGLRAQ